MIARSHTVAATQPPERRLLIAAQLLLPGPGTKYHEYPWRWLPQGAYGRRMQHTRPQTHGLGDMAHSARLQQACSRPAAHLQHACSTPAAHLQHTCSTPSSRRGDSHLVVV